MRHFHRLAALCLCITVQAQSVHAGFILDEFVDSAMVSSPAIIPGTQNEYLESTDAGMLGATRNMRIFYLQGEPSGVIDVNIAQPSTLTAKVSSLNPRPNGQPFVAIQATYSFPSTDFTESGKNNALLFDFLRLDSEMPPSRFKTRLNDSFDFDASVALSPEAFTIAIPFDRYLPRPGQESIDPTEIEFVSFSLWVTEVAGGGPDPLNLHVELDRIRVGRIPEPKSAVLVLCSLLVGVARRLTHLSKEAPTCCSYDEMQLRYWLSCFCRVRIHAPSK